MGVVAATLTAVVVAIQVFSAFDQAFDASDLALCAIFMLLAAVTAVPILIGLLRKGDAEPNEYGPVPAGIDP